MWKVLCSFLMLMGLAGGGALAWTADDFSQLLGLYDARGWGFMASLIVFAMGLLLLLMSGSHRKSHAGGTGMIRDEDEDGLLAIDAEAPDEPRLPTAASQPARENVAQSEAPRHPAFEAEGAPKPH